MAVENPVATQVQAKQPLKALVEQVSNSTSLGDDTGAVWA